MLQEEPRDQLLGAQRLLEQLQVGVGAFSGHRSDIAQSDCCPNTQPKDAGFHSFFFFPNKYGLSDN